MRNTSQVALVLSLSASVLLACNKPKETPAATEKTQEASPPAASPKELPSSSVDSFTFGAIGEVPVPADNPQTADKIALGHKLFFDKQLSGDGKLSCYSCHQNENGNGGADPKAIGAFEKALPRHSPVIWNVGYLPVHYWDGRSKTLEAQALAAWSGGNLGFDKEKLTEKAKELAAQPAYKELFNKAFPGEPISETLVAKALSAYERTLVCKDTDFDKYAAGDKAALSDVEKQGLEIFMGKAMCSACHAPPFFSTAYLGEGTFFNVGIGTEGVEEKDVDVGRMKVTNDERDWAAFKPPSLRNITKSAPYFHDGHTSDLKKAVKFMASGGHDNKNKTPLMSDKKLTDEEIDKIVTFLGALECRGSLTPPRDE